MYSLVIKIAILVNKAVEEVNTIPMPGLMNRDVHFAVNSKILLSAVTQFEFAVNSAVNRNYQRYEKR